MEVAAISDLNTLAAIINPADDFNGVNFVSDAVINTAEFHFLRRADGYLRVFFYYL